MCEWMGEQRTKREVVGQKLLRIIKDRKPWREMIANALKNIAYKGIHEKVYKCFGSINILMFENLLRFWEGVMCAFIVFLLLNRIKMLELYILYSIVIFHIWFTSTNFKIVNKSGLKNDFEYKFCQIKNNLISDKFFTYILTVHTWDKIEQNICYYDTFVKFMYFNVNQF